MRANPSSKAEAGTELRPGPLRRRCAVSDALGAAIVGSQMGCVGAGNLSRSVIYPAGFSERRLKVPLGENLAGVEPRSAVTENLSNVKTGEKRSCVCGSQRSSLREEEEETETEGEQVRGPRIGAAGGWGQGPGT